jgi:autotransporter-associated beta strand protein
LLLEGKVHIIATLFRGTAQNLKAKMRRISAMPWSIFSAQRLLLGERQLGEARSRALRGGVKHVFSHVVCMRVIVGLLFLAGSAKFSFAQEFEPREFEARAARHERHAGTGEAEARADRHARAGHGHRHHHTNTTTAITTNTTPATTTTPTTTNANTPKPPPPGPTDPFWDTNGATAGSGGPSPNGLWDNTTANWTTSSAGTTATTAWTANGDAVFSAGTDATGAFTVTIPKGITISANSITVNNSGSLTIVEENSGSGAILNLGAGGIMINSGAGAVTINSASTSHPLVFNLTAAQTWTNNSSNLFTVSSDVTNGANLLTITGTGNTTISGVFGAGVGPSGGLTKNGAGILTLSGGGANTYTGLTTVNAGELDLAKTGIANAIGSGGLTINGGTVKYTGASTDEIANTANVTISGGTLDLNSHADTIGSLTFNSGTLTSTGGTQTLTLSGSTATTLQMQGAATIPTSVNIAFSSTTTSGVGMTFDATNNGTATINGNINLNSTATTGITRTFTINDGTAATDTSITGVISNTTATGLTKAGAGTLALSGANLYTGTTTVSAGTLLVNNITGSGTGTGAVVVNNSGTVLGGTGTISGTVNVNAGAIINPGPQGTAGTAASVGTLTTGALTLVSTAIFHGDASGTLAINWDKLVVNGLATLGSSTLQLIIASGLTFTPGTTYTLIDASTISGTFSGIADNSLQTFSGYEFIAHYNLAGDGNFELTAVPEPSTWAAGALALASLVLFQRRRISRLVRRT